MSEFPTIQQHRSCKVLLIGESCKDEYHYGVVNRIAAEAPVPVFQYESQETRAGMAANVRSNLVALGVVVDFVTNLPDKLIKRRFVDTRSNQLLMREDIESPVEPAHLTNIKGYDALVISDYRKGLIDSEYIREICLTFDGPIFVDSKNPNLSHFETSILKVNEQESQLLTQLPKNHQLITTLGKRGAAWNNQLFAAPPVDVFDVTGAGDVFLAALTYTYLQTMCLPTSIRAAVFLSSRSVQHMGIYTITRDDVAATRDFIKNN